MGATESYLPHLLADARKVTPPPRAVLSRDLIRKLTTTVEVSADLLVCASATTAAYNLQLHFGGQVLSPHSTIAALTTVQAFAAVLLLEKEKVYEGSSGLLHIRETERSLRASTQSLLVILVLSSILQLHFPIATLLISALLTPLLLLAEKQMLFVVLRKIQLEGHGVERVIVYGAGSTGRRITSTLLHSPRLGLFPVAVVDDSSAPSTEGVFELGYKRRLFVPLERRPITAAMLKSYGCNLLVITVPDARPETLADTLNAAALAGVRVAILSTVAAGAQQWNTPLDLDGLQLATTSVQQPPWHYELFKRWIDITISFALLVTLLPLLILIALLVRSGSSGPALFTQQRVGRKGRLFKIYKFRSMHRDTPHYATSPGLPTDPRITTFGRFLRRTSLDELPQLLNVLRGDMSLVGPRPEMPFIVEHYSAHQRRRLHARPGLTGLWQLSADRSLPIHENLDYDLYYLKHRAFSMDVAILIHTLFFAIGRGI